MKKKTLVFLNTVFDVKSLDFVSRNTTYLSNEYIKSNVFT